jgi:hypothetical protein
MSPSLPSHHLLNGSVVYSLKPRLVPWEVSRCCSRVACTKKRLRTDAQQGIVLVESYKIQLCHLGIMAGEDCCAAPGESEVKELGWVCMMQRDLHRAQTRGVLRCSGAVAGVAQAVGTGQLCQVQRHPSGKQTFKRVSYDACFLL